MESKRKFGAMPEWAKTGPIDRRNYAFRAEAHCAQRAAERSSEHPTIRINTPEFRAWEQYFTRHLGGYPKAMQMLIDRSIVEMTVPEIQPEWFDPNFIPNPHYKGRDAA